MKMSRIAVFSAVVLCLLVSGAFAAGDPAKGKALFNDPKFAGGSKACSECHPGGKGAEKAAAKNDIERIVNGCITHSIKGKALDVKSVEMRSIVLYIKSLVENPAAAPKKAPVGC